MPRRPILSRLCLSLLLSSISAYGQIYVTTNGSGGGTSWGDATSLANALAISQDGDDLWIAQGTYTNDWDGTTSFVVSSNNLTLYGGFTNGMAFVDRDWTSYPTILDGEDARRVLSIAATDLSLDGLIIRDGYVPLGISGGGMYKTSAGSLTLANCKMVDNYVLRNGNGGGAYVSAGSLTITNCTFSGSTCNQGTKGLGFYAQDVNVSVDNCTFSSNLCPYSQGGGFYVSGGTLAVSNSLFIENRSAVGYGHGAGAYVASAPARFMNCIFKENDATVGNSDGAGLYVSGASATVTVENCTFNGNMAGDGGAMYLASGNLTVTNCTMANNSTTLNGGAFHVAGGVLVVKNSIAWSNSAAVGNEIYNNAGDVTVDYSCLTGTGEDDISGVVTLSHVMTNDPLFVAEFTDLHLKSISGRWDSVTSVWTNDTVHSPCIDVGNPSSDYSNEPADNGGRINLGAYANTAAASKSLADVAPVVENRAAETNLTAATLKGELMSGTLSGITIYYGTNQVGLGSQDSVEVYPPQQTGSVFSADVTGLLPNQLYYYACFATNAAGTNWAAVTNFTSGSAPISGGSDIIHVDKDASGAQTGLNWFDAYLTLSVGVAAANDATNEIWVADGTYKEGAQVEVATNVSIYGGFTGAESNRNDRSLTNEAIFSGNDTYRVLNITSTNVTLDGLIIQDGYVPLNVSGAGIYKTTAGSLMLASCIIRDNFLGRNGLGGGACVTAGSLAMTNCTIAGTTCDQGSKGMGFYTAGVDLSIVDCTFSNNTARWSHGGGFYITGGTLAVTNSLFIDNTTTHGYGAGTGGHVASAPARFKNCIFKNNADPVDDGGGLYIAAGASTTVTVENCSFEGNSANEGGAVYLASGNLDVKNCTIVDNSASLSGGAFYINGGDLAVQNSILWSNSAVNGNEIYRNTGSGAVGFSCLTGTGDDDIYGAVTLSNVMTNDPLFATEFTDLHLKSISGRWDSVTSVWTNDTVHSPCIDVGDPTSDYSNEPADNGGRNNLGTYGNTAEASKSPVAVAPVVENRAVDINLTAATLKGELMSGTLSGITIYYGTNQTGLGSQDSVEVYPPQQTGSVFSVEVTDLLSDKVYYYVCFATNAAGTNWAAVTNFTSGSAPISGGADIIHVDKDASGGQTGLNWLDAYLTLSVAVAAANDATNEIWVADGTYTEGAEVAIATNLSIYGGFTGAESNRIDRSLTNEAIFSGNDTYRVLNITSTNVTLDGLIISDGYSSDGGGIYKTTGGPFTLANCVIRDCYVTVNGDGAGASVTAGSLTMTNCTFSGSTCNQGSKGMGLYAANVNVSVDNCTFSNNIPTYSYGGGFYVLGGTLAVSNSTFTDNNPSRRSYDGDAGYVNSAPAQFINCVFNDNGNSFTRRGAGLCVAGASATVTVENCVFNGNVADDGGAIYLVSGDLTVTNCTIADNSAALNGGAFHVADGTLTVKNSIVWSNSAAVGNETYNNAGDVIFDYSCLTGTGEDDVYGGATLSNVMTKDPLFVAEFTDLHLKSISGRWDSVTSVWTNDAVHSPGIDVGDPTSDYSNEPADNGGRINLGAYGNTAEASKSPVAVAPVVENRPAVTLYTSATLKGELMSGTLSEITIYYGTNQTDLGSQDSAEVYPLQQTGSVFSAGVTELLPDQLYYYACFATNAAGTNWAAVTNFTSGGVPISGGSDIIHVDKDAVSGSESGRDWLNAYLSLSAAVAAANDVTNEIWVADGTYTEGAQVEISTNVSIYGGFTGTESNRNDRSLTNEAIFSGNDTYRVLNITSTNVTLDGLIISDGYSSDGGGIYKTTGGPFILANCVIRDSYVTINGDGAGASVTAGSLTMTDCTFSGSTCNQGSKGMGLYAANVNVSVDNCTFSNNISTYSYGGAFYVLGGTLAVSNSTFAGNGPSRTSFDGDAGYVNSAPAQFMNCVFNGNGNSFTRDGAALYIAAGASRTVTVENCTFAGNFAKNGGASYVASGNLILKNSILWTNTATTSGDEIYATGADSDVDINYTDLPATNSPYVVTTNGASVTFGNGILTADPLFATEFTDLHLKSEFGRWVSSLGGWTNDADDVLSPCIDAGDPASVFSREPVENRARINMGAYGNTGQASKSCPNPGTMFQFL